VRSNAQRWREERLQKQQQQLQPQPQQQQQPPPQPEAAARKQLLRRMEERNVSISNARRRWNLIKQQKWKTAATAAIDQNQRNIYTVIYYPILWHKI